jgi:hypothetical protein
MPEKDIKDSQRKPESSVNLSENESKPGAHSRSILCTWCRAPLHVSTSFKELVCLSCYRRLFNAGVSDEEIFNSKISQFPAEVNVKKANG